MRRLAAASWVAALGAAVAALVPAVATAASFDCAKASTRVETTICQNPELSTLDDHLGRYYAAARQLLAGAGPCLQARQRSWLQGTRNACNDAACLRQAYLRRLAELHPLQPGATALRQVELPSVPGLVWVIPPARDTVAAPPRPNLPPLVVRGRIVNDVAQGDGYVIRTREGRSHTLLPLMFLDGPSVDRLAVLAQDTTATFEAQGQAEPAPGPGPTPHFAPGQCTWIYRVAP